MSESLFLVRHGPTHARALVGWTDLPADLSDTAALARLQARIPPQAQVISSDLSRAVATADAIQGPRARLAHHADLREMHFGAWEMTNPRTLPPEDRARLAAFWSEPGAVTPPGGENWLAFSDRVHRVRDMLWQAHGGPLVIVAHFGVIVSLVQSADELPHEEALGLKVDNLSLTELRHDGQRWRTVAFNQLP